jgi:hypothetical protein
MRHATLLEAFQSASELFQQGLGIYSREKKYELDTDLFLDNEDFNETQSRIVSQLAKYGNDPAGYNDYALKEIAAWEDRARARGNGSKYYLDQVNRIKEAGTAAVKAQTFKAGVLYEQDRKLAEYTRERQKIINDNTPDEIIRKGTEWSRLSVLDGTISESQKVIDEQLYATEALKKDAALPEVITERPEKFNEKLDRLKNNPSFAIVPNRDQYLDAARNLYRKAFQDQNFNGFESVQNEFVRLLNKGDPQSLQKARNLAVENQGRLTAALKDDNPDYSSEQKSQMRGWLKMPAGTGGGSKPTEEDVLDAIERYLDAGIGGEFKGQALSSLATPAYRDVLSTMVAKDLAGQGKKVGSPYELYLDNTRTFNKIVDLAVSRVREQKPAIGIAWDQLKQWVDNGFMSPKQQGDVRQGIKGYLIEGLDDTQKALFLNYASELLTNTVMDHVFTPGDEETVVKKIADVKALLGAKRIELQPRNGSGTATFDRALGTALQRYYNPNSAITTPGGEIIVDPRLSQEWIQGTRGLMKNQVAEYLAKRNGIAVDTALASLVDPRGPDGRLLYEEERDARGVIDVDLPGAFGFRNAQGRLEYYRVYPKDDTWEIQMKNETGKWETAPGKSGDSASVIRTDAAEWSDAVTEAQRNRYAGLPGINAGADRSIGAPPLNDGTKAPPGTDQRRWDGTNRVQREIILDDLMRKYRNDPESDFMRWFYQVTGIEPPPKEPEKPLTPYQRSLKARGMR